MEEVVLKVVTNTIGYTRKQAGKEWFDEEFEEVKKTLRANNIQRRTRTANNKYRQARSKERNLL
jgi:hypothetical protein